MMTAAGLAQLKQDEGCELSPYPDPGSELGKACTVRKFALADYKFVQGWAAMKGDPWTDGYGNTHGVIVAGPPITQETADAELMQNVAGVQTFLSARLSWWGEQDPVRQDVLTNLAFNVGPPTLLTWPHTLALFQAKDYAAAAIALLHEGPWDEEVGNRSKRLAIVTAKGDWAYARQYA